MHNWCAVPPSTKAPLIPEANHRKKIETIVRADLIGAHKLNLFSIFSSISHGDNPSAPPINDQHDLINISLWLSTGTVVLNHTILRHNLLVMTSQSQVTFSSHLIMTISLIISWFLCSHCCVLQGDLYVAQKCYQHPGKQWVIVLVSFWRSGGSLLTAGTLLIAGLVYCEGQHGCPPSSYFSLAVKQDNLFPNRLVLFIKGFSLIGGSLGLVGREYQHDRHTTVWGWKIIGCMLWLLDTFSAYSTEVFLLLFCCLASRAFVWSTLPERYHLLPHGGSSGQKMLLDKSVFFLSRILKDL